MVTPLILEVSSNKPNKLQISDRKFWLTVHLKANENIRSTAGRGEVSGRL